MLVARYKINNCMQRVFITAPSAKAGSTLLAWLLAQHSYIKQPLIPEEDVIGHMLNILDWTPRHDRTMLNNGLQPIYANQRNIAHIQTLYDNMVNPNNFDVSSVKFVGFTSFNWLQNIFSNDNIIVIIRNPLDWYVSWREWPKKFNWKPVDTSVEFWISTYIRPAALSLKSAKNIKVIHFENLVKFPVQTMTSIYQYLGWPPEPITFDGHLNVYNNYTAIKPVTNADSHSLVTDVIGRGKHLLEPDLADKITAIINGNDALKSLWSDFK